MNTRSDFQAISGTGGLIKTFATRDLARKWWNANAGSFPYCRVIEVTVMTTERTIWKHKPVVSEARQAVFG